MFNYQRVEHVVFILFPAYQLTSCSKVWLMVDGYDGLVDGCVFFLNNSVGNCIIPTDFYVVQGASIPTISMK